MFWVNKRRIILNLISAHTREETEVAELGLELNPLSVFQHKFYSTEHRIRTEWLFSQLEMPKREVNSYIQWTPLGIKT